MRLGFVRSDDPDDGRVGATPETVATLTGCGLDVEVGTGAGTAAGHSDEDYEEAGAEIVDGDGLFT